MKNIVIIICLLSFFSVINADENEIKCIKLLPIKLPEKNMINVYNSNGLKEGLWIEHSNDYWFCYYENSIRNGPLISYFPSSNDGNYFLYGLVYLINNFDYGSNSAYYDNLSVSYVNFNRFEPDSIIIKEEFIKDNKIIKYEKFIKNGFFNKVFVHDINFYDGLNIEHKKIQGFYHDILVNGIEVGR